jgi:hypothetical protein
MLTKHRVTVSDAQPRLTISQSLARLVGTAGRRDAPTSQARRRKEEPGSPSTTASVRGCHLCLRYVLLPMSPGWTCLRSGRGPDKRALAPRAGFEPATSRLTAGCSTAELPRNSAQTQGSRLLATRQSINKTLLFPVQRRRLLPAQRRRRLPLAVRTLGRPARKRWRGGSTGRWCEMPMMRASHVAQRGHNSEAIKASTRKPAAPKRSMSVARVPQSPWGGQSRTEPLAWAVPRRGAPARAMANGGAGRSRRLDQV